MRKKPIPMAIDPKDLFDIVHRINNLNTIHRWSATCLASFLYLTGARITEALNVKFRDIEIKSDNLILVDLRTLKSKIYTIRKIPISPVKTDKPFFEILKIYLTEEEFDKEDYVFPFSSRFLVYRIFEKITIENLLQLDPNSRKWIEKDYKLHPHYFRHCRLSHLVSIFNFSELELMRFAGWSSTKPCVFYIKLNYKDLLKKMVSPEIVLDYVEKFLRLEK